jgi:hypothetical protein
LKGRAKNLLLAAGAISLALLACEIGLRLMDGVPLTRFADLRERDAPQGAIESVERIVDYDPVLSWTLRPHNTLGHFNTVQFGIRRSSAEQSGPRIGAVLVVGGSVTLGGGNLSDEQPWPAALERIVGQPVDNAAVPGFGLDQSVLRAEALIPILRPRMLLVSVSDESVRWSGRSRSWGVPKPFFSIEAGALRLHNNPVPRWRLGADGPIRNMLGHFHLVDRIMTAIDPDDWLTYGSSSRGVGDPMTVACLLLERLKAKLDHFDVRGMLVPEPTRSKLAPRISPPSEMEQLVECGERFGYGVVPSVAAIARDYQADPQRTATYFSNETHYTELGSRRLAEIVAATLPAAPGPGIATSVVRP